MKHCAAMVVALCAFFLLALPVFAQEPVQIHTPQDLAAMAEDPYGSYILMADLDMSGIAWESVDFFGTFDGNGHAIVNLTLDTPGAERPITYDGNQKPYETACVGLFGVLRNATVKNLKLINVRSSIQADSPCFVGAVAGYIDESTVNGCTVTGVLELLAWDRMFGIGGIAGYGDGHIEGCEVDVTLICTDTGKDTLDEQFMGGILAAGYADIRDCRVNVDGYCSEYGYCHNGGMVGMLMRYPLAAWDCTIENNSVSGKITFFECNADRRAYCDAVIGEYMTSYYFEGENETDFIGDERYEYDRILGPEVCEKPDIRETVVSAGCDSYGYTQYSCAACGYTYRDQYTLFDHIPGQWTVVKEANREEQGLRKAWCPCGQEFTEPIETLPPETTAQTEPVTMPDETQPPETQPAEPEGKSGPKVWLAAVFLGIAAAAVIAARIGRRPKGKYAK